MTTQALLPAHAQLLECAHGNRLVLEQLINANQIPKVEADKLFQIFDRVKALLAEIPKETTFKPLDRDFTLYPVGLHREMEKMRAFCLYPKLMIQLIAKGYCISTARILINNYLMDKKDEPTIDDGKFSTWLSMVKRAHSGG